MSLNLAGIEVFVKVVKLGSISAAARALDMPITTASGQLAALEKRLGMTLIQRTTRKLHVTEAGEAYFKRCASALTELDTAGQELAALKGEPSGLLRVTATQDIASKILPPLISGFLTLYPKLQIELTVTYRLVDFLAEGIDLGLRFGDQRDSSLKARKFMEMRLSLWASPDYLAVHGTPQTPAELKQHPLLGHQVLADKLTLHKGQTQVNVSPLPGRVIADDYESIKAFLRLGMGIGVMPDYMAQADVASGQLIRVLPEWSWASLPLRFVYPAQRFVAPPLQRFIEYCLEHKPVFD